MSCSFDGPILSVQAGLSRAQAIPILGPIFVSPVKGFVSVAQIALNLFAAMGCSLCAALTFSRNMENMTFQSLAYAGSGALSLMYTALNFNSFGIAGFLVEFVFNANPGFL